MPPTFVLKVCLKGGLDSFLNWRKPLASFRSIVSDCNHLVNWNILNLSCRKFKYTQMNMYRKIVISNTFLSFEILIFLEFLVLNLAMEVLSFYLGSYPFFTTLCKHDYHTRFWDLKTGHCNWYFVLFCSQVPRRLNMCWYTIVRFPCFTKKSKYS